VVPAGVWHFESAWSQTTQPRRSPDVGTCRASI
jgi:hypothetical protein